MYKHEDYSSNHEAIRWAKASEIVRTNRQEDRDSMRDNQVETFQKEDSPE
jgi:hypothetical protein